MRGPEEYLTAAGERVMIDNMSPKKSQPISDVLRDAILNSGLPLLEFQRATGVHRASISRFLRGERSLRLDRADVLAAYLGVECRLPRRQKRG